jgi:hypothetical protein
MGVTVNGQPSLTSVGAQTIVALVVLDSAGKFWQFGASTSGQLTATAVSPAALTSIIISDAVGNYWQFGVTPAGQPDTTLQVPVILMDDSMVSFGAVSWGNSITTKF